VTLRSRLVFGGKSKEIRMARGVMAACFGTLCTYYRRGCVSRFSSSCVFLSVSLSSTLCIYLTRSLATFLRRDRKSGREGRRIRKRSERIGGESGPSIKTLKITEFLLVFLGALRKPGLLGGRIRARITGDLLGKKIRVFGY